MVRPRTWSDDQLAEAVKFASSWGAVVKRLGLTNYGKTIARVRGHATRLGLDVSHLRSRVPVKAMNSPEPRPATGLGEEAVREAIEGSLSWAGAAEKLGLCRNGWSNRLLQSSAVQHGIDVSGLYGQSWRSAPIEAQPVPFSRLYEPTRLHQVGAPIVMHWFMSRGYMASVPVDVTTYDLIVESDDGLQRIQVKTSRSGSTVGLTKTHYGSGAGKSTGRYGQVTYQPDEVDFFFVVTGSGALYLIPFKAVEGKRKLTLERYRNYKLANP